MNAPLNLIGRVYGRLTVIRDEGRPVNQRLWLCDCTCGSQSIVRQNNLQSGKTTSCGCGMRERYGKNNRKHGAHGTPEYVIFRNMVQRCENPKLDSFARYGGRGIKVCTRWRNDFAAFYADMGPRPSPLHSIDRRDVDGDYCHENCRWATNGEQSRNMRSNRMVDLPDGRRLCLTDVAKLFGIKEPTLRRRLNDGWSLAEALKPAKPRNLNEERVAR